MNANEKASAVIIPNAREEGKLPALKPTNGNADVTVTRDAIAYEIDKQGYFRPVLPNWPLLSHKNGGCTHTLLNPQRTRLSSYPISFGHSDWSKAGCRIEGDPLSAETNGVANPSFEDDMASPPNQWLSNGTHTGTALADGTAPSGSNVCEIVATGIGSFGSNHFKQYYNTMDIPIVIGETYLVTFYAKRISGGNGIRFGFQQTVIDDSYNFQITDDWVQYSFYHYMRPSTLFNAFSFQSLEAGGITFRIDAVSIQRVVGFQSPMLEPDFGTDVVSGWNFTSGWNTYGAGVTIDDADTFTSPAGGGGIRRLGLFEVGKHYKCTLEGNTTGSLGVRDNGVTTLYKQITTAAQAFEETFWFTAVDTGIYFSHGGAGTTNISKFEVQEILPTASTTLMKRAFKLVEDGSNGNHRIDAPAVTGRTPSTDYSVSLFALPNERTWLYHVDWSNVGAHVFIDVENEVYQSAGGNIKNIEFETTALGYKHIKITYTLDVGQTSVSTRWYLSSDGTTTSYQGVKGEGMTLFFFQPEVGSYTTTPIWNGSEGAQLTRVMDQAILDNLQATGILGAEDWTIILDLTNEWSESSKRMLQFYDETSEIFALYNEAAGMNLYFNEDAVYVGKNAGRDKTKMAIRCVGGNTISVFYDGALAETRVMTNLTSEIVKIQSANSITELLRLSLISPFNIGLPDADCIALTT